MQLTEKQMAELSTILSKNCNTNNTNIELVEENEFSHEISPPFTPMLDYINNPIINHNSTTQDIMDSSMENPNLGIIYESNNWVQTNTVHDQIGTNNTTDLLTLLHLPRCPLIPTHPSSGLGFLGGGGDQNMINPDTPSGSGSYDPLFHLNLPPQPSPLLRDLMFQTLPIINGEGNNNGNIISTNSMYGRLEEGEGDIINGVAGIYLEGDNHSHINIINNNNNNNGIFEFTSGNIGSSCLGEDKEGKCPKNFVTERQRRQNFNDKYNHLRRLVPNPTKPDRASIVKDAIDYIQELKRTVGELKLLVEKKRISKERSKRHKTEDPTPTDTTTTIPSDKEKENVVTDGSGQVKPDPDEGFGNVGSTNQQLRSSWLTRKWKDTEVDVRIVDDDVTIKLVQRKKVNCLLGVAVTIDELQLDLRHVAGGHVGDYYTYLFNTKICEGSSVYASAIAHKLIEVVERHYTAAAACSF